MVDKEDHTWVIEHFMILDEPTNIHLGQMPLKKGMDLQPYDLFHCSISWQKMFSL